MTTTPTIIDVSLTEIKVIFSEVFKDDIRCRVYLFGSRAMEEAVSTSDFDLAVWSEQEIIDKLSLVREKLEASNIPYKVDLVDLAAVSPEFRQHVLSQGRVIWKN